MKSGIGRDLVAIIRLDVVAKMIRTGSDLLSITFACYDAYIQNRITCLNDMLIAY